MDTWKPDEVQFAEGLTPEDQIAFEREAYEAWVSANVTGEPFSFPEQNELKHDARSGAPIDPHQARRGRWAQEARDNESYWNVRLEVLREQERLGQPRQRYNPLQVHLDREYQQRQADDALRQGEEDTWTAAFHAMRERQRARTK